jgi:putative membrane protein
MIAMMFGYGYGGGWPVWAVVLMWVAMLAFLGVLIWGGYALMTNTARRPRQERRDEPDAQERRGGPDPRQILDDRLARGEIDAAEYQRLRDLIAAGDGHAPAGTRSR